MRLCSKHTNSEKHRIPCCLLVAQEEAEARRRGEAAAKLARAEQLRQEMVSANEAQLAAKASAAAVRKAEEDKFSRKLLERFAEEDRLEQMNAQKRRMKVRGWGSLSLVQVVWVWVRVQVLRGLRCK